MAFNLVKFDESLHPRAPAGGQTGGQFVEKGGAGDIERNPFEVAAEAQGIDLNKGRRTVEDATHPKIMHRAFLPGSDTPEQKYVRFGNPPKSGHSTICQSPNWIAAMLGEVHG